MTKSALRPNQLDRLLGTWTTQASHPAMRGVVVSGTAVFEWLAGGRFLSLRAANDHADFPDSLSVLGYMGRDRIDDSAPDEAESELRMHYFDSRGVFRVYDISVDDIAWRWSRVALGFSQRFTGRFQDDGNTIAGRFQVCEDGLRWEDDLEITYRRRR